jgi:hypothetical protein
LRSRHPEHGQCNVALKLADQSVVFDDGNDHDREEVVEHLSDLVR